ncbi:MAG: DUF5615 family PIN-like protein [Bifidobacteriaceae bacterium]|nr:DUF5615 family PIN-like protein [Bifidobacteriaceae bacterium]
MAFLLDEHYPPRLAELLAARGVNAVTLTHDRPSLRGRPDDEVLRRARSEGLVVVTEDVTTFMAAVALVPDHRGVVLCHQRRYPRTPSGLPRLADALTALTRDPPGGFGTGPLMWWL